MACRSGSANGIRNESGGTEVESDLKPKGLNIF